MPLCGAEGETRTPDLIIMSDSLWPAELPRPDVTMAHHYWRAIILVVAGGGFEPPTFGLCVPLQLSLPGHSGLWSGLSLHPRPNR